MLGQEFESWLISVKSYSGSVAANRISACRRVERELHINLDEVYHNAHEWDTLIDSFKKYTRGEWERGIEPTHGISFASGGNWYTGTKNILSALMLYDMFKKDADNDHGNSSQEQLDSTQFSLEACPNTIFREVMNIEAPSPRKDGMLDRMSDIYESLNDRERILFDLLYGVRGGTPLSLDQISSKLNVPRERLRQIEAKMLRKMRHPVRHP